MEHTDCQAVKLLVFVACLLLLLLFTGIVCSMSFLFNFSLLYLYCILYCKIVIYAVFLCYLMAFDCQELKGLLTTYLLTYNLR